MGSNLKKQASSTLANGNGNGNGNEQWAFLGTTAKRTIHLSAFYEDRGKEERSFDDIVAPKRLDDVRISISSLEDAEGMQLSRKLRNGSVRLFFSRIKFVKRSVFQNPVSGSTYPNALVRKSMDGPPSPSDR